MAAWAIGKFSNYCDTKIIKVLITLLKDNYWKVRTAACVSLGCIPTNECLHSSLPLLIKILNDGSINRLTVCETIMRFGQKGEEILLNLLRGL